MRILIAEDDEVLADGLARSLRQSGYAVDSVKTGSEADSALSASEFDLLILDIGLPRMNGLEFVKAVRADQAFASMKVMMVTSHNEMADIGHALEEGANDFLMKPFTGEMVSDKLRMLGLVE